jgi:hypothetical protein
MCESFVIFNLIKMKCNIVVIFQALHYGLQIMVIRNNHEFDVLLNYKGMCV